MMQRTSLVSCSNSVFPSPTSRWFPSQLRNRFCREFLAPIKVQLPLNYIQTYRQPFCLTHSSGSSAYLCDEFVLLPENLSRLVQYGYIFFAASATQEIVETSKGGFELVEIGYISSVHGIQGEICVKPNTDFPELRFCTPGKRWLRQQVLGRETILEVELVEGREHYGQKSWILTFEGVDTVEEAKSLVGSTLLAKEEDRPELEEEEFYTRDLVGMKVFLKETGEPVGTVVNVFNSGANDLLHVMLNSSANMHDGIEMEGTSETDSGPLVWIPFVEAIVPNVDIDRREMRITPPKGLLSLNIRADERSKKERRQLEWKERKKFQKRLIAAKKKLCELEQQHMFHGFRYGEKSRTSLLAHQIVGVNSKLLQLALQNVEMPSKRWNVTELTSAIRTKRIKNTLTVLEGSVGTTASKDKLGTNFILQEKGLDLVSKGKMAMVLVIDPKSIEDTPFAHLETILCNDQISVKIQDRAFVPLILVCAAHKIQTLEKLFSSNDHFGFDREKVWFLEEEQLPVVSSSTEEQKRNKILMKSPWEILQSPVGSGGVISVLSSHNISENLIELGVEYIEICKPIERYAGINSLLLGFVNSCEADIGIQISEDSKNTEETYDVIFSIDFLKKMTKQINKLQFYAIPKSSSHVEMVDKEWINVIPSSPNSIELHSTIYSCINACSLDKVCVMGITE